MSCSDFNNTYQDDSPNNGSQATCPIMTFPINSMWPSDTIWWHRSGSKLAQVMVCCLMAPSHYLTQCWLVMSKVPRHLPEEIIICRSEDISQQNKIEICIFKSTIRSPMGNVCIYIRVWIPTLWISWHTCINHPRYWHGQGWSMAPSSSASRSHR